MIGGAILDKRGKEDLSDEVREKAMWEKSIPGRINNLRKGPGAGIWLRRVEQFSSSLLF